MTKHSSVLLVQDARGVASLTLNRPEVRNAFDAELIATLIHKLTVLGEDPVVRVVHIKGAGAVFCAGADLNWMRAMADFSYTENLADANQLACLMQTLYSLPKPTIAQVQGGAYGGGLGLAACCDLVVAETATQFCLSEVKLGLIPAVIAPFVLRKIGPQATRRYALTAERFSAAEAKRIQLVDEVVDAQALDACVAELTEQLLTNAPQAMMSFKALLETLQDVPTEAAVRSYTTAAIAARRVAPEGQEGMRAFLEKRKPNWNR